MHKVLRWTVSLGLAVLVGLIVYYFSYEPGGSCLVSMAAYIVVRMVGRGEIPSRAELGRSACQSPIGLLQSSYPYCVR
jgi:hypothetical protein